MENSFLQSVTEDLYRKYGDKISEMKILLPNHRSILFFNEHLAKLCQKPLWQPEFTSIDEIMCDITGLTHCDRIRAITELYKIYSTYHKESFDTFYFWGEILLNDLDAIDKYMIDADMLFKNIFELKSIENDLSYLTPEQIAVIKRFWQTFEADTKSSAEKESFLRIWKTLAPIYHKFCDKLAGEGTGYTGMIQRLAAQKIKSGNYSQERRYHYAVIGFNALSKCEKILFDYLRLNHDTDFYWDYDEYYLDNRQEAGLFIRENIARYPQSEGFSIKNTFSAPKQITAVSAASDSLQCKYVASFLKELPEIDKNTAVILADESLLMPVLYSLPECVKKVNITMGYPLKQSLAYSFVERLFLLQAHKRSSKEGKATFYHSDVEGILTNPYIESDAVKVISAEIMNEGHIYVPRHMLAQTPLLEKIFTPVEEWEALSDYIIAILDEVASADNLYDNRVERMLHREMLTLIATTLTKLTNSLRNCGIELDIATYNSMARKLLQAARIPFSGEPLSGLQIMGILETRNLDFDNIILLSANDSTFPASRSNESSYIPYNLRFAYGLPTPEHHEGVYAYYFYRLIQRCKRADIVYCSRNNEKSTGEPSRYIYQLEYESPHTICHRDIAIDVNLTASEAIVVEKSNPTIRTSLEKYLQGERKFSPSSFNVYMDCPIKFYLQSIIGIRPQDELSEEIDLPMFGTILHQAMETIYKPLLHHANPRTEIKALIGSSEVSKAIDAAIDYNFYHGRHADTEPYEGNVLMVRESVRKYINECILPYDAVHAGGIIALEYPIECRTTFTDAEGKCQEVIFGGKADRIDLMPDNKIRIIDYKTGSPHQEFTNTEKLQTEDTAKAKYSGAVMQTFLYSMMVDSMQRNGDMPGRDVCPSLYYVRRMMSENYSPLLNDKGNGHRVECYSDYREDIENFLRDELKELFDPNTPFKQCENVTTCQYCDFKTICNRK